MIYEIRVREKIRRHGDGEEESANERELLDIYTDVHKSYKTIGYSFCTKYYKT